MSNKGYWLIKENTSLAFLIFFNKLFSLFGGIFLSKILIFSQYNRLNDSFEMK